MTNEQTVGVESNGATPQPSVSPIVVSTSTPPAQETQSPKEEPVELFRSYEQGIMDGLLGTPTHNVEYFIDAFHRRSFSEKSIELLQSEVKELLEKKTAAKAKLEQLANDKCAKEAQAAAHDIQITYLRNIQTFWKEKIAEGKENAEAIKSMRGDYGMFAGLIFFFFALLFIAADYTICLTIVANTLKIGLVGGKATLTSHLFALAMSGLAVVLKPAYDRLVEKPYRTERGKKVFSWVILIMAISVIMMLFTLGVFREEAASVMAQGASRSQPTIGPNGNVIMPPQVTISHGWAAKFGIISSTILFAIAGAICLGISIPIFHQNYRNVWNRLRRRRWHKREQGLLKQIAEEEKGRSQMELEVLKITGEMQVLQPEVDVDQLVRERASLIQVYRHGSMVRSIEKSTSMYLAGYVRGRKLEGKATEEWIYHTVYQSQPAGESSSTPGLIGGRQVRNDGHIGRRTRPFVAIRRMISNTFKKKWNQDNDINIEYYNFD